MTSGVAWGGTLNPSSLIGLPTPGDRIVNIDVAPKGVQISAFYGGNPWLPFGCEPAPGVKMRSLPGGWLLPEDRFKDFQQPAPT